MRRLIIAAGASLFSVAVFSFVSAQADWKPKWKPPRPPIHTPPITVPPVSVPPIDPLKPIREALRRAQDELKQVRGQLDGVRRDIANLNSQISAADKAVRDLQAELRRGRDQVTAKGHAVVDLEGELGQARGTLKGLEQVRGEASKAKKRLDKELATARDRLKAATDKLLSAKLVAYDITTQGALTYNFASGSFYASVKLPGDLRYDTEKLKSWVEAGKPALPGINPVEAAFHAVGLEVKQTSGYAAERQARRAKVQNESTYFASDRLVEWLSPETLAEYAAKITLTGGEGAEEAAAEARSMLLLEYNDLMSWAYLQGMEDLESLSDAILQALISRNSFEVDSAKLDFDWFGVDYYYEVHLAGMTELPLKLLPGGASLIDKANGELARNRLPSKHQAFSLQWSSGLPKAKDVARKLVAAKRTQVANRFNEILGKSIDRLPGLKPVKAALLKANKLGTEKLAAEFQLDMTMLSKEVEAGTWLVNLKSTPIGKKLAALLRPFAQGNESSATVEELELDLASGRLSCRFSLRHRHSWGTLQEAWDTVSEWAAKEKHILQLGADKLFDGIEAATVKPLLKARSEAMVTLRTSQDALSQSVAKLDKVRKEAERAAVRVADVDKRLGEARKALAAVSQAVSAAEGRVRDGVVKLERLRGRLPSLQASERTLEARFNSLNAEITNLKRRLGIR
jgi:predicted  nucleic acid-binding Zn-ribbon protein